MCDTGQWALARQRGKRRAVREPWMQTWVPCLRYAFRCRKNCMCVSLSIQWSQFFHLTCWFVSISHLLGPIWKKPVGEKKENRGWKISDRCRSSLISLNLPETTKKTSPTSSVPVMLCLLWTGTLLATLHDTVKTSAFIEPFERSLFQVVWPLSLEVTVF